MDRDETSGTGSCRATSSDQYRGEALQRIQQTQVALTYPPPDVREGLWFRWPVIGEVVCAGLLATGKDMCQAWNSGTVSTGEALGVGSSSTLPN